MMTISVELAPDEERKLEEAARARGQVVSDFVRELIRNELSGEQRPKKAVGGTFDEVLAPMREGWEQSGMTQDEIMALFEETRNEVRRERRARKETPRAEGKFRKSSSTP
jgi:hypothetical protein